MTIDEAIEYLKRADMTVGQTIKTRTAEALEMAIEVLEQEPRKDEVILTNKEYRELVSSEYENGYANGYREALEQEPCEDAISRQLEVQRVKEFFSIGECYSDEYSIVGMLNSLPSVQPEPKTGHWIAYEVRLPDRTILNYRCSVCGRKLIGYNTETLSEAPFCHCGAKMLPTGSESEGV